MKYICWKCAKETPAELIYTMVILGVPQKVCLMCMRDIELSWATPQEWEKGVKK